MSNPSFPPEDARLANALRSLPVPAPSADFDDRVLAALRVPVPWWKRLSWRSVRQTAQPLFLSASCSLAVTLLALHLTLSSPVSTPSPPAPAAVSNLAAAPPAPLPSVDALLDRPNLCAGSLAAWNSPPAVDTESAGPEKTPLKPEPRRRAEVYQRPTLVA